MNLKIALLASVLSWGGVPLPLPVAPLDTTLVCKQGLEQAIIAADASEKDKVAFVKELDTYLRSLGLVKGSAFCVYNKETSRQWALSVKENTAFNSGKQEPLDFFFVGTEKEMREKEKTYSSKKYDTDISSVYTPSSPLAPNFLAQDYIQIAKFFIHERLHDNFDLPRIVEEAICDAASYQLMHDFFTERGNYNFLKEVQQQASEQFRHAKIIIDAYDRLQWVSEQQDISEEQKQEEKEQLLEEAQEGLNYPLPNTTQLAGLLYYHLYFQELYLIPQLEGWTVKKTLSWYHSLHPDRAEQEILQKCEEVKCKGK